MKEYEDPKYLLGVIAQQNQVLEQVIAERDDLRLHLENLAPGAPDALACLRRVYNDPKMKEAERVKAAAFRTLQAGVRRDPGRLEGADPECAAEAIGEGSRPLGRRRCGQGHRTSAA